MSTFKLGTLLSCARKAASPVGVSPPARENSRQYSPRFSRKMRESLLRTLARKAGKYKEKGNV